MMGSWRHGRGTSIFSNFFGLSFSLALEFGGFQHAYPACYSHHLHRVGNRVFFISTFFVTRSADWAVALFGEARMDARVWMDGMDGGSTGCP
jgi:hypothetical protein